MRILIFLAMIASLLGCSYNLEDIQKSKQACADKGGQFSAGITPLDGTITTTYCSIDGVRYSFNRADGTFFDGIPVR